MFRKNKGSEKTGARARNTPFGAYCYALTNKEHRRMRSVRIYVLSSDYLKVISCVVEHLIGLGKSLDKTSTRSSTICTENLAFGNKVSGNP
uniref:Uncharacterized protein n=1 Tax=Candidatus Kentrum sp. SD TaxID=2126332 RepID=A0A450Y5N2_9GAMM|nr:MAG: hypothetical protein BECKSD772F_GA0070984_100631 [Candidatus Kentron sp. SD]VFK40658.1 MAG: hypothetical protein BECKSD772E_GA0070983_100822 [Candidatus Kentron sp. SD]